MPDEQSPSQSSRSIVRSLPPPFNTFADMTGCDDKGVNEFPIAVNPANVEGIAYFPDLTLSGVAQLFFVSGRTQFIKIVNPLSLETATQWHDGMPTADNLYDPEDRTQTRAADLLDEKRGSGK